MPTNKDDKKKRNNINIVAISITLIIISYVFLKWVFPYMCKGGVLAVCGL
jgi:hypothetical protein